jgi:hypothetical protein
MRVQFVGGCFMAMLMQVGSASACFNTDKVIEVAENKFTAPGVLLRLANHPDESIRAAVADNPHTPHRALIELAFDESEDIRFQMAENHNLPVQVLLILVGDANPYISWRAEVTLERLTHIKAS